MKALIDKIKSVPVWVWVFIALVIVGVFTYDMWAPTGAASNPLTPRPVN